MTSGYSLVSSPEYPQLTSSQTSRSLDEKTGHLVPMDTHPTPSSSFHLNMIYQALPTLFFLTQGLHRTESCPSHTFLASSPQEIQLISLRYHRALLSLPSSILFSQMLRSSHCRCLTAYSLIVCAISLPVDLASADLLCPAPLAHLGCDASPYYTSIILRVCLDIPSAVLHISHQ